MSAPIEARASSGVRRAPHAAPTALCGAAARGTGLVIIANIVVIAASMLAGCNSPPTAPSPQGVMDTSADFMPPGSSLQGARRLVVATTREALARRGGCAGTFTLTNRGRSTVILASVEPASEHVMASSPGAMPYRVDPGKSFLVTVTVMLPWDRALTDGGLARVLTTDGETINLWLQLVMPDSVPPVSAAP